MDKVGEYPQAGWTTWDTDEEEIKCKLMSAEVDEMVKSAFSCSSAKISNRHWLGC